LAEWPLAAGRITNTTTKYKYTASASRIRYRPVAVVLDENQAGREKLRAVLAKMPWGKPLEVTPQVARAAVIAL
jgi:hypothetical protein